VKLLPNSSFTVALLLVLASPTMLARAQAPDSVSAYVTAGNGPFKAGDAIPVHIELNSAPNILHGFVMVQFNGPGPAAATGQTSTSPDKKSYDLSVVIPDDAPGGKWVLSNVYVGSATGMQQSYLKFKAVTVEVTQDKTFSLPTEASVSISPSQTQLLRERATEVQNRLDTLKANLRTLTTTKPNARIQNLLRQTVRDADGALTGTEQSFLEFVTDTKQKQAANIFFSDLHAAYQTALKITELKASTQSATITNVAYRQSQPSNYPAVAEAIFPAFEQNQIAYTVVADTGSLTFDLEVRSLPEGAKVTYGRRGDSSFQELQDPTDSTIRALPYAVWTVRFEKKDFVTVQRDHNALTERNHVMTVELTPEKR
jgi:hypothetical protein